MAPGTTLARNQDALFTDLGGEFIAMDIQSGDYFNMSSVAARIWELIETPRTFDALCKELCTIYEIDAETCSAEAEQFVTELAEANLIVLS